MRIVRIAAYFLTFGVVGALLMSRSGSRLASAAESCAHCRRSHRMRRLAFGFYVTACLGFLVVRGTLVTQPAAACQPQAWHTPGDVAAFASVAPTSVGGVVRSIADAVPTGAGLAYSRALGANVCTFSPQGIYVADVVSGYVGRGAFDLGQFVLSQPQPGFTSDAVLSVEAHEAVHTRQWSAFTIAAGPLAFPASYFFDELFFPGAYNHFERNAGLINGGYWPPDQAPPARSALMLPAAAALIALVAGRSPVVRKLRSARHGRPGCPRCGRALPNEDRNGE
jgi:hypothetical protein